MKCQRTDPLSGASCMAKAQHSAMYKIRTEQLPRGIEVCGEHLQELRSRPDLITVLEVRDAD